MIEIGVTVRELAAFCHRSGDIDRRFTPSPTAVEGVEGHQRLYARRPGSYQREYPVEYRCHHGDIDLFLRGRADGYDPQQGYVEEIKTCRVPAGSIPEAVSRMHLAQGRLYAALIARSEKLDGLEVRLTWYNIDSGREDTLAQYYSAGELSEFLDLATAEFCAWLQLLQAHRARRDSSIDALEFPHGEFRPGQRQVAELVYKCIDQAGELMVQAPTGLGKTAAVLYPALKALARGKHERIVYVTAKTVGRRAAETALRNFGRAGMAGSALSLTAREQICFEPGKACHGADCPFALGYFDRARQAMREAWQLPALDRESIEALARRHRVCPYQLGMDLLPWADLVICDQHYLYGPGAPLPAIMEQRGGRWTILLDEAHNLPGRARGMYAASISKAALMALKRQAPPGLGNVLQRLNRVMLDLGRQQWPEPEFCSAGEPPQSLLASLEDFSSAVSRHMQREPALLARNPALQDFYHRALRFLRVVEYWGEEFRFEMSRGKGRQSLEIAINCLDPARLLGERNAALHALVAFSATLSPAQWSRDALGLGPQSVYQSCDSPFQPDQLQVRIVTDIDTRYRQREASLDSLAGRLLTWLAECEGNCMVYFPSYQYLGDCLAQMEAQGLARLPRRIWRQSREAGPAERDGLIALLESERNVAAFCILGGVFGEGIDLPGNQLTAVAVVGVGLPRHDRDTAQLQEYFQWRYGRGFEYACLYPGMQKVDQALGRVVRGPQDQGRALLIDSRYRQRAYRGLLPPWWAYTLDGA